MRISAIRHVAVIPAKRHSSRCPNKNWQPFVDGQNLVEYTLARLPAGLFERVIVSTDHGEFAPPPGVEVHRREPALATVEADVQDLLRGLVRGYELSDAFVWLLNPTTPFRNPEDFAAIRSLLAAGDCPAVISVTPTGAFLWRDDEPQFATVGRRPNSQEQRHELSVENGMFYVFHGGLFLERGTWYLPAVRRLVQNGLRAQIDIDTPEDFTKAQRYWQLMRGPAQRCVAGAVVTPAGDQETIRNEALAIEQLVAAPVAGHVKLLADHFARYALAAELLQVGGTDRVLDASCGTGYGSFVLAQHAGEVVGVDVNAEHLATARRLFERANLTFLNYDEYRASAPRPADKLVCIETYEHVPVSATAELVQTLLESLRVGGSLLLSCPLGRDGPSPVNPHHLNEPSLATIANQFSPAFERAEFRTARRTDSFGQTGEYCLAVFKHFRGVC